MGYTVLPNPPANRPATTSQEPVDLQPPRLLPTAARPVEAFGKAAGIRVVVAGTTAATTTAVETPDLRMIEDAG